MDNTTTTNDPGATPVPAVEPAAVAAREKKVAAAKAAAAVAAPAVSPKDFTLGLGEFCARLSATVTKVELIGGFEHQERAAGRNRDTQTAFAARFAAFAKQPVKQV
jgi:hypothetical protein